MTDIRIINYKNYGKCVELDNGKLNIVATLDCGPRIISAGLCGMNNLMFNDDDRIFSEDVSSAFGENERWYIYGGHRMWVSPEHMPLSYYPDNCPIEYELVENGVILKPATQRVNNLRHAMELRMTPDEAKLDVIHYLTNESPEDVKGAIWALSVMDAGGVAVIPQPQEDTGLLGNRILALWPYTNMADSRIYWGTDHIALRQDSEIADKFKLGINNTEGWIAYFNHGQALVKSYSPDHVNGEYPDFGVSTEVFTNGIFLEAETLSPLFVMKPGDKISHTEHWQIFGGVNKPEFCAESISREVSKLGR